MPHLDVQTLDERDDVTDIGGDQFREIYSQNSLPNMLENNEIPQWKFQCLLIIESTRNELFKDYVKQQLRIIKFLVDCVDTTVILLVV